MNPPLNWLLLLGALLPYLGSCWTLPDPKTFTVHKGCPDEHWKCWRVVGNDRAVDNSHSQSIIMVDKLEPPLQYCLPADNSQKEPASNKQTEPAATRVYNSPVPHPPAAPVAPSPNPPKPSVASVAPVPSVTAPVPSAKPSVSPSTIPAAPPVPHVKPSATASPAANPPPPAANPTIPAANPTPSASVTQPSVAPAAGIQPPASAQLSVAPAAHPPASQPSAAPSSSVQLSVSPEPSAPAHPPASLAAPSAPGIAQTKASVITPEIREPAAVSSPVSPGSETELKRLQSENLTLKNLLKTKDDELASKLKDLERTHMVMLEGVRSGNDEKLSQLQKEYDSQTRSVETGRRQIDDLQRQLGSLEQMFEATKAEYGSQEESWNRRLEELLAKQAAESKPVEPLIPIHSSLITIGESGEYLVTVPPTAVRFVELASRVSQSLIGRAKRDGSFYSEIPSKFIKYTVPDNIRHEIFHRLHPIYTHGKSFLIQLPYRSLEFLEGLEAEFHSGQIQHLLTQIYFNIFGTSYFGFLVFLLALFSGGKIWRTLGKIRNIVGANKQMKEALMTMLDQIQLESDKLQAKMKESMKYSETAIRSVENLKDQQTRTGVAAAPTLGDTSMEPVQAPKQLDTTVLAIQETNAYAPPQPPTHIDSQLSQTIAERLNWIGDLLTQISQRCDEIVNNQITMDGFQARHSAKTDYIAWGQAEDSLRLGYVEMSLMHLLSQFGKTLARATEFLTTKTGQPQIDLGRLEAVRHMWKETLESDLGQVAHNFTDSLTDDDRVLQILRQHVLDLCTVAVNQAPDVRYRWTRDLFGIEVGLADETNPPTEFANAADVDAAYKPPNVPYSTPNAYSG